LVLKKETNPIIPVREMVKAKQAKAAADGIKEKSESIILTAPGNGSISRHSCRLTPAAKLYLEKGNDEKIIMELVGVYLPAQTEGLYVLPWILARTILQIFPFTFSMGVCETTLEKEKKEKG
jgi:hypothetical protein